MTTTANEPPASSRDLIVASHNAPLLVPCIFAAPPHRQITPAVMTSILVTQTLPDILALVAVCGFGRSRTADPQTRLALNKCEPTTTDSDDFITVVWPEASEASEIWGDTGLVCGAAGVQGQSPRCGIRERRTPPPEAGEVLCLKHNFSNASANCTIFV